MAHPYASVQDMVDLFTEARLNKLEGINISGGVDARMLEILNMSSREMDGYFEKYGYIVPLTPSTPGRVKDLCRIIAFYWIYDLAEALEASDKVIEDYKNAIAWLKEVADGDVKIGATTKPSLDDTAQDKAQFALTKDDKRMTQGSTSDTKDRDSLGGFALNDHESGAS